MYSLLVSADPSCWKQSPTEFPSARIFEHTVGSLKRRFAELDDELLNMPALFAYESPLRLDARVGRVTRIQTRLRGDARIGFDLTPEVAPISPDKLVEMAWDLDIGDMEFTRTHWSVKEVDLLSELARVGLVDLTAASFASSAAGALGSDMGLVVGPKVFNVPASGVEDDLVSVMRPFKDGFDCVSEVVGAACAKLNLRCMDANMVWHESEVIQDVFSLLYRSRVVVCDFSDQNPNVFYEAGIAHTLGRPVIPIVRNPDDVPFDLRHHRYQEYEPDAVGLAELMDRIEERLRSLLERAG